jgi:hypothetical protein
VSIIIGFFVFLIVAGLILTLLRLLVLILPVLSVLGLAVLLLVNIETNPVVGWGGVCVFAIILIRLMSRESATLQPPRAQDDSSTESQAEAARSLKTRSVLWFLPHHDQGAA